MFSSLTNKKILQFLNPIVSVRYYQRYYDLVVTKNVERPSNRLQNLTLHLVNLALAAKALHFGYLSLGGDSDDNHHDSSQLPRSVRHADSFVVVMHGWQGLNRLSVVISVLTIYLNHWLFRKADLGLLRMLHSVLVQRKWPLFTDDVVIGPESEKRKNTKTNCQLVTRCFLWTLRFLLSVVVTFVGVFVFTWTYFAYRFLVVSIENPNQILGRYLPIFCASQLSMVGMGLFQLNFAHVVALNFALTGALLTIFYVRMRQLDLGQRTRPKTFQYRKYRLAYLRTLCYFLRCNHCYGQSFCAFLVAMCPVSIAMTLRLLQPNSAEVALPVQLRVILHLWILWLMALCFVWHVAFARCTRLIHDPPRRWWFRLMSLGPSLRSLPTDFHFRLALDLQSWHVRKQYGFTYGTFGLVTVATFVRFVLLYSRFTLIGYKLLRETVLEL